MTSSTEQGRSGGRAERPRVLKLDMKRIETHSFRFTRATTVGSSHDRGWSVCLLSVDVEAATAWPSGWEAC